MINPPPLQTQSQPDANKSRKIENRLFERFSARFPVKYKHTRTDYGSDVFLRDASAGGVKISTRERVFFHDSLSLEVKLPDGTDPVTLNGRVVWIHNKSPALWEAGMELHKIDLMEMQRIFKFIESE